MVIFLLRYVLRSGPGGLLRPIGRAFSLLPWMRYAARFSLMAVFMGALCAPLNGLAGQTLLTENTLDLDDDEARNALDIEHAAWLVGTWRGEGFGGTVEEVWLPAAHGQMAGMFRFFGDTEAGFSEIMALAEVDGQTLLRVKHFNPDFTGWETQNESVDFRFVSASLRTLHFKGLTLVSPSPDRLEIYIAMRGADGELREEALLYRRVGR